MQIILEWGINHLPEKPDPMFDHFQSKDICHSVQSEPSLMHLCAVSLHLVIGSQEEDISISPASSLQEVAGSGEDASEYPLLRLGSPGVLSLSSQSMPSSPFTSFGAFLQEHTSVITSFFFVELRITNNIQSEVALA